jgi:hypothetical protein
MSEQVVQRDRSEPALHGPPRQVVDHRAVEVERPFLDQLESEYRGKRLADRPDGPQGVGRRFAEGLRRERSLAIGQRERHCGRPAGLKEPGSDVLEGAPVKLHGRPTLLRPAPEPA